MCVICDDEFRKNRRRKRRKNLILLFRNEQCIIQRPTRSIRSKIRSERRTQKIYIWIFKWFVYLLLLASLFPYCPTPSWSISVTCCRFLNRFLSGILLLELPAANCCLFVFRISNESFANSRPIYGSTINSQNTHNFVGCQQNSFGLFYCSPLSDWRRLDAVVSYTLSLE